MSFEGGQVYYADQMLVDGGQGRSNEREDGLVNLDQAFHLFMHFILETQVRNTYIYR